ncbi:c-type cytochrome [Tropicimonas marinistellae]|uniref:c-type cytochrome n=1 Tax=Tropicimonas marinistellae TaxID=1739787 RepID=UPI000837010E|nr:cytochrome c [Tropicimonas marinistellae]
MPNRFTLLPIAALLVAGAAFAHQDVSNPAVLARMQGMSAINDAMKTLSAMVKGDATFDADAAAGARAKLVAEIDAMPGLFAAPETDPKSEARPEIWTDPATFAARIDASRVAVAALDTATLESLAAGFTTVGLSCKGCHDSFRQRK